MHKVGNSRRTATTSSAKVSGKMVSYSIIYFNTAS